MGKKSDMIKCAVASLGQNYSRYCSAFWGGCYAWCASAIAVWAKESGNGDIIPWTTSCTAMVSWFKIHGGYLGKTTDIRVGDIVFYEFYDPTDGADHVGIVTAVDGDNLTVVEGNKGNAGNEYTKVECRYITKNYSCICEVCRPNYDAEEEPQPKSPEEEIEDMDILKTVKNGSKGQIVENLQTILISAHGYSCGTAAVDGDFGADTEKAVRNFQTDRKIEVDGIVGPQTWKELFK